MAIMKSLFSNLQIVFIKKFFQLLWENSANCVIYGKIFIIIDNETICDECNI